MMRTSRETERQCLLPAILAAAGLLCALGTVRAAEAQDITVAGSVQGSYLFLPTTPQGRDLAFDGFTTEASLKLSADVSEQVSAQVKVCYGCHGFELSMAFADLSLADELNVRVGRFNPSFGDFPLRHDPANHRTVDKPLMYDMGRMLRIREWNMSILPVPYVDHGVELNGVHWFSDDVQLSYAAYAVAGLRGSAEAFDFDYIESRSPGRYYVDNNSSPAGGGRLSASFRLGDEGSMSLGMSGMYGVYDPNAALAYLIVGADFYIRYGPVSFRSEYVLRRTEMFVGQSPENRFRYGPDSRGRYDDYFLKDGWYGEVEVAVDPAVQIIARFDGMRRTGNVPAASQLRSESVILRYTAGVNLVPDRSFRVKLFAQFYDFTDFDDEVTAQAAVAANF